MLPQIVIGKCVAQVISMAGIGNIVGHIVRNNVPIPVTTFGKIKIVTATTVISGLIAEQSNRYISETADQLDAIFNRNRQTEENAGPDFKAAS